MAAGLSAVGCCTTGSHGLKDPGQEPSPNGTSVNAWFDEHETRGEADDFTIHLNEWYMGSHDLGPMGLHRLGSMIRRLHEVPFPIILAGDKEHWQGLLDWIQNSLVARGKVGAEEVEILQMAETPEAVLEILKKNQIGGVS